MKPKMKPSQTAMPWILLILFVFNFQWGQSQEITENERLSYLALGDSYTIGESVCETCTYAHQLVDTLQKTTDHAFDLQIIAKTGWTTSDLLQALSEKKPSNDFDLVTLLIGVNNQYQGKEFGLYEKEFPELLNKAIYYAKGNPNKVVVLSIPDYAFTPFGQQKPDPHKISTELDRYNAFAQKISEAKGVLFIPITDITRKGLKEPSLVAKDRLHPSAAAYHRFVKRLYEPVVKKLD